MSCAKQQKVSIFSSLSKNQLKGLSELFSIRQRLPEKHLIASFNLSLEEKASLVFIFFFALLVRVAFLFINLVKRSKISLISSFLSLVSLLSLFSCVFLAVLLRIAVVHFVVHFLELCPVSY